MHGFDMLWIAFGHDAGDDPSPVAALDGWLCMLVNRVLMRLKLRTVFLVTQS